MSTRTWTPNPNRYSPRSRDATFISFKALRRLTGHEEHQGVCKVLKSFRTNEKLRNFMIGIVALLLASYVLVGMGSGQPKAQGDTIAKLGSTKIKLRDAWIQLENIRNTYRQFDRSTVDNIAVSQLMSNAIMMDGARNLGITVSDAELRDYVIDSRTLSDGTYIDNEDWEYRVKQIYHVQVDSFEEYMRDHNLLVQKYRDLFFNSAYVSEKDILERFEQNSQKVQLEMLTLNTFDVREQSKVEKDSDIEALIAENPEEFRTAETRKIQFVRVPFGLKNEVTGEEIEVSDNDISEYYNANIARYQLKERVKASHILIKPDGRTDEEALQLAQKVRTEIEGGLDFAEAAKKYSEDDSNKNRGGDLGTFNRGKMVKPFEEAVFSMDIDGLSNPVKTQFGYHLIKKFQHMEESTRPMEEVKAGIVNTVKRNKSKAASLDAMNAFHDSLADKDFATAAADHKLEILETPFFDNDRRANMGDILRTNPQARNKAFELANVGDYSTPMTLGQEAVVIQYVAEGEPRALTLADDEQRVKQIASTVAGRVFIEKELAKIREAAEKDPEKSFKDLKGNRTYIKDNHFKTTSWVDANTVPYELRTPEMDFSEDIYSLEKGSFRDSFETSSETRFALVRVTDKEAPDMSKLDEERHNIIQTLRAQAGGDLFSAFMYGKRQEYDPDNRVQASITSSLNIR